MHKSKRIKKQLYSMDSAIKYVKMLDVSLVTLMVKNLPAMQEMRVRSLGWEDPLEEGMATHSSILA